MSEAKPAVPRPRIEGLSDLIFGLALSIGAIQLLGSSIKGIEDVTRSLSAFAFSFLILIIVWNRYTTFASVVPAQTKGMIRLNVLLLFLVAIEPYLFNILLNASDLSLARDVSIYYALDLGGMNMVLAYFAELLTKREKEVLPVEEIRRFKLHRNALLTVGSIFLISALPFFWDVSVPGLPGFRLRIVLWILSLPAINMFRNIREVNIRSRDIPPPRQ